MASVQFPRLNRLLRDLNDPKVTFSAVLGAGISVSAGYSAFRSTNSLFQLMYREYKSWPDYTEEADSFLSYAFSVRAVLNDPRVHFRVLRRFGESSDAKVIHPTIAHCFLTYLAEIGRLSCVVTQNVDRLEEDAGLRRLIGNGLIEAHGVFDGPGCCPNVLCPGAYQIGECRHQDKLSDVHSSLHATYSRLAQHEVSTQPRTHYLPQHDLKYDVNAPVFSRDTFMLAVHDDCVACCAFCGSALKPSMVLYGEDVNVDVESLNTLFFESYSILIIGTSMNVFPVSMLPLTVSARVSLHFIAKQIRFQKYLNERLMNGSKAYSDVIAKRHDRCRFKHSQHIKARVIESLATKKLSDAQFDAQINYLTPDFCFHKGESDALVLEILKYAPEMASRVKEIYQECKARAESQSVYQKLVLEHGTAKCGTLQRAYKKVIIIAPHLFPPDAIIYDLGDAFAVLCLCTNEQIDLLRQWIGTYLNEDDLNEEYMLIADSRFTRKSTLYDQVVYRPIGGHWASYCIAYNAYYIQTNEYVEDLDPWSSNFVGYRQKDVFCEKNDYFCYSGVVRTYMTVQRLYRHLTRFYLRQTQWMLEKCSETARAVIHTK